MNAIQHITADIAAIGLAVASTREVATAGVLGVIEATLTDGRRLRADYGPAGVHAWRWLVPVPWPLTDDMWSTASAATAGDALAASDFLRNVALQA